MSTSHLPVLAAAAAAALGLIAAPVVGQGLPGLSFVAGLGYEAGGPGMSLMRSMTAADLDDVRLESGASRIEHPRFRYEGLNLALAVGGRYRFDNPFSLEALLSNGSRGHAEGYDGSVPYRLLLRWSSVVISAGVGYRFGPLRAAVGPTLLATFFDVQINQSPGAGFSTLALGSTGYLSISMNTEEAVVSALAGIRTFPATPFPADLGLPLAPGFRTWFFGVSVSPAG